MQIHSVRLGSFLVRYHYHRCLIQDFQSMPACLPACREVRISFLRALRHGGIDGSDRQPLSQWLEGHGGGPAGLDTLAAGMGEDPTTLETFVEPFLLQLGFLQRTPRGRVLTEAGRSYLVSWGGAAA
jgi:Holliday junction resolvasome RuvABC ATP-dependent DNA helicase subunit